MKVVAKIKIGILTHYHDTVNYGGALQAYALCKLIEDLGYSCEQIDINCFAECRNLDYNPPLIKRILKPVRPILKKIRCVLKYKETKAQKQLRNTWRKAFYEFNNHSIPHSKQYYTTKNIADSVYEYDVFIVGSDQVWNPIWYFEPFFLTFVPDSIPKIAYAASLSQHGLSQKAKEIYSANLKGFSAISVREKEAISILSDVTSIPVEHVLDPTLILSNMQWDKVASDRLISKPYILCYFLGNSERVRELAKEYADKCKLVTVNIQNATAQYHSSDVGFGDVVYEAPSPREFLSLIKHAEYVFTDSFHAMAFSFIFRRQFLVFERQNYDSMGTRVKSFVELLCIPERFCFCEDRLTMKYIHSLKNIDYSDKFASFKELQNKSLSFLVNALKKAELLIKEDVNNEG